MFARPVSRMTLVVTTALIVLVGGSFLGCRRANAGKSVPAEELALTESDAGRTLHLDNPKSVALTLTSNGSIGYGLSFEKITGDALVPAGEETKDHGPPAPGNSETTVYRFRAVKAGQAAIVMNYTHRTGSTFTTEIRTFTIIVYKAP